ncbi:hypothetical protein NFJ02_07g130980 [Pycnococcus provasolii]
MISRLRSEVTSASPSTVHTLINDELLPSLDESVRESYGITGKSEINRNAYDVRCGTECTTARTQRFHERPDVIAARDQYVRTCTQLEMRFDLFTSMPYDEYMAI